MKTYVYIIECRTDESSSDNPVKIGYTSNLKKRLGDLQVGSPYPLVYLAAVAYDSEELASEKEKHYHKMFNRHHIRGEWFKAIASQGAAMAHFMQLSSMQQVAGKVPSITKMFLKTLAPQTKKSKKKWARKRSKE